MKPSLLLSAITLPFLAMAAPSLADDPAPPPTPPTVFDQNLAVRPVVEGLGGPTSIVFLPNVDVDFDMLVLEKNSGRVRHFVRETPDPSTLHEVGLPGSVLDLPVNFAGTRGLLGIALHPEFSNPDPAKTKPWVYLFWTQSTAKDPISGQPVDNGGRPNVDVLGNRVDRYVWNGSTLTFDRNLIKLRALQTDGLANLTPASHNGGILRFGPDGKLYIAVSDVGRRGWMQNLECGTATTCSSGSPGFDDIIDRVKSGPQPDNNHLTGVILRLNDDGTPPADNPFFAAAADVMVNAEVKANIQKIFAYGIRNLYGMTFDPASGNLWLEENGEDSFSELHRIEPGQNGGWVQIRGPVSRIAEYKAIETGNGPNGCHDVPDPAAPVFAGFEQGRFDTMRIADTPEKALSKLVMLPGAHYKDPEFSWRFDVAPAGIGFMYGRGLGPQYENDLFVGAFEPESEGGGYLFHSKLTDNRQEIAVDDHQLEDRVADNGCAREPADIPRLFKESKTLLFGEHFGIGIDIQTAPNGNLFVVSAATADPPNSVPTGSGAIFEIFRH